MNHIPIEPCGFAYQQRRIATIFKAPPSLAKLIIYLKRCLNGRAKRAGTVNVISTGQIPNPGHGHKAQPMANTTAFIDNRVANQANRPRFKPGFPK